MIATSPASETSKRSFYFVITVASLLVGAAIGAHFAPVSQAAAASPQTARPRVWTEVPVPVPPPPIAFAQPPPPAPPPPKSLTGMASCDLYIEDMEALAACDKLPIETRAAMRQGIDAMRDGWGNLADVPFESRKMAGDACQQAHDAIGQVWEATGCHPSRKR